VPRTRKTAWRTAHGNARAYGRLVVLESVPADELPPASPGVPARPDRDAAGRFLPGNALAGQARVRAGANGALSKLDAKADPAWQSARRWGQRAAQHRIRELAPLHGGSLSAGVCALIVDACDLRADARYIAAKARAEGSADLARAAASLLASARQCERDAWEIAHREGEARRRSTPWAPPWLANAAAEPAQDRAAPTEPTNEASTNESAATRQPDASTHEPKDSQ
jgi:hypothetical protein